LRAAIQTCCEPTFAEFVGTLAEALDFAIRANLHRRQLNDAQRAMVAEKIEPLYAAAAKQRTAEAGRGGAKVTNAKHGVRVRRNHLTLTATPLPRSAVPKLAT
jgi:hypothetical protein